MRKKPVLAAVLALLLLLPGCTAEDRERIRENGRIYALAQRDAARLAVEYVEEKYGFEAAVLGYDVDGSDVFMAYRAHPLVTVALTDGEKEFLVYLGLKDAEVRWDNYQAEEVAACLEVHLLSQLGRTAPAVSRLTFRVKNDCAPGQIQIDGSVRSVTGMLDFYYEGQTAEELLELMALVDYEGRWMDGEEPLAGVGISQEDWPEEISLALMLKNFRDEESHAVYGGPGAENPSVKENPALLEALSLTLRKGKTERVYSAYDRFNEGGLAFVGRATVRGEPGEVTLPTEWVAGQVSYPQIPLYWPAGEKGSVQCGPLFCCTRPEGPEGVEYAISCTVLPGFFEQHGDMLYYGICDPATGEQNIRSSLPFRPGKPGTYEEGNVYIRQTFWVDSPADRPVYYAILRRIEDK